MSWLADLAKEIDQHGAIVRVTVVRADGSTPREVGAAMVVSAGAVRNTIGGGALELVAIAHARGMLESPPYLRARPGPPPSCGEGLGMGGLPPFDVLASPPPSPSPTRGEGTLGSANRVMIGRQVSLLWNRNVRDFPLGPSLGQCCGGYARLLFEVLGTTERAHLAALGQACDATTGLLIRPVDSGTPPFLTADRKEHCREWPLGLTRAVREMLSGARPRAPLLVRGAKGGPAWFIETLGRPVHRLYLYGAGHVGRAIVRVLEDLPFAVTWVDTSANRFPERIPPHAKAEVALDPAAFAGATEAGAFHLVLSYSHALDLAICHSLLRRGTFGFLGLIGSATKRARFLKRLAELGIGQVQLKRLVCPIGLPGIGGKEPAAIAVAVAAQLVQLGAAAESCEPASSASRADNER